MLNPKITVYITAYNYGKYVERSIDSVINQSIDSWELIVINDGSTDDTKQIIEKYRTHPKIKIVNQENKGLNITNNIALRMSQGDYFMRLDADDFLTKDALEKLSDYLDKNHSKDLVYPKTTMK